jgi:glycosyltransferase involved in cell wall biosynthesis
MPFPPPLVTCVMTAFDDAAYVERAVASALAQTGLPEGAVEIVAVDDGSTDGTLEILESFGDPVRVLRQERRGPAVGMHRAIDAARGRFVSMLDADDEWLPHKLSRALEIFAARPEVGLVYGDMTVIDEDGEVLQGSWLQGDATPEGRCLGALLTGNNVTGSTIVVRGDVLRAIAPIPAWAPWTDWWLAVRCAEVSEIAYLAEPHTLYRFHGDNMSLGAQGERRRGELCKAAGFQRHLLRTIPAGSATPAELTAAWAALERNVAQAIALADSPFRPVLDVDAADRADAVRLAADGMRRLDAGDAAGALWPCVRAAAADPWNDAARAALGRALAAA